MKSRFNTRISGTVQITLDEDEARALEALTRYGTDAFLDWFYKDLGSHYLKPYESGLTTLFESIKTQVDPELNLLEATRNYFKAQKKEKIIMKLL